MTTLNLIVKQCTQLSSKNTRQQLMYSLFVTKSTLRSCHCYCDSLHRLPATTSVSLNKQVQAIVRLFVEKNAMVPNVFFSEHTL